MDIWGATLAVVSGGQSAQQRQADGGYEVGLACSRCGARPETLRHRIGECAQHVGHPDYASTGALVPQALTFADAEPSHLAPWFASLLSNSA
eukprot:1382284-Pyramimonas_sp.AAC.1